MAKAEAETRMAEVDGGNVRRARSKTRELKAALEAGGQPAVPGEAKRLAPATTDVGVRTTGLRRPLGFSLITTMGFLWAGLFVAAAALTHFGSIPGPILLFNEVVPLESVPAYVSIPGFLACAALAVVLSIGFHQTRAWGWAGVVIATGFMALSGASDLVVSLVVGGPGRLVVEMVTGLPYLVAGLLPFAYALRARTREIFASAASNGEVVAVAV